jgi:hypothetical protein
MAATPPTTFFSAKKVVKETHRLKLCYKWSCINVQTANFLGDILAERRAFTFNRTYFFSPKYRPVRGKNGLGGCRGNEQQSI